MAVQYTGCTNNGDDDNGDEGWKLPRRNVEHPVGIPLCKNQPHRILKE